MNKAELITAVAEKTGSTKKEAELAVNAFVSTVEEALKKGEKVQLRKPGEVIKIAASTAPVFKAGKALKDAVNK